MSKLQITSGWVAAGISGWLLCATAFPAARNAAVTEDDFLLRTTGDLVDLCKATPADALYTAAINFCHGFAVGVYRMLQEQNMAESHHAYCLPDPPPRRNDAISAFVQWADANPDQKNRSATDGIAAYMMKQHPCDRGKR